jgi:hypothetical protein
MTKPKDHDIPIAFLRECFDYDPATGALTWRERPLTHFKGKYAQRSCNAWNALRAGKPATRLTGCAPLIASSRLLAGAATTRSNSMRGTTSSPRCESVMVGGDEP